MTMPRLQRAAATLRAWGAGLRDYLASPSAFPPIDATTLPPPEPPQLAHELRIVLVGGPYHLESFTLRPQPHLASLVIRSQASHTGDATYLRREGDLDALGRERWYFDRPTSTAGDA